MTTDQPTDDIIAYIRRECICSGILPSNISGVQFEHPNEACPFNRITDLAYGWRTVRRTGIPRNEGGTGVSWYCDCQDGDEDRARCQHITQLLAGTRLTITTEPGSTRASTRASWEDDVAILTPYGDSILRAIWAQDALRESEVRGRGVSGATAIGPTGATGPTGPMGAIGPTGPVPSGSGPAWTIGAPAQSNNPAALPKTTKSRSILSILKPKKRKK